MGKAQVKKIYALLEKTWERGRRTSTRQEGTSFICRAGFDGINIKLIGTVGKGDTPAEAEMHAQQNLLGTLAGIVLHPMLFREVKKGNGPPGRLVEISVPILRYIDDLLKLERFSFLNGSDTMYNELETQQTSIVKEARRLVQKFADEQFSKINGTQALDVEVIELEVEEAPRQGTKREAKEIDSPSTSRESPAAKKAKKERVEVITVESDEDLKAAINATSTPLTKYEENSFARKKHFDDIGLAHGYEQDLLGVTATRGAVETAAALRQYRSQNLDVFVSFDNDINKHYALNAQDDKVYSWKMGVRQTLLTIAQKLFPEMDLQMFAVGSTVNGCGSYNSDMDLCLVYRQPGGPIKEGADFARPVLKRLWRKLYNHPDVSSINFIGKAVVPIIKLEMMVPADLEVDINLNNIAGVYNSHLMHYYARVDDRFPTLCLLIKHWAIKANINDALSGTFNSYSLILLVLHYLQCGVFPAVLPNLQYLYPDRFASKPELNELNLFGSFEPPLPTRPLNEQSVGELLIGFFQYYSKFDFDHHAISIRRATVFDRKLLAPDVDKTYKVFIEEPFDGRNTARCVRANYFHCIRNAFKEAAAAFEGRKKPRLAAINVVV